MKSATYTSMHRLNNPALWPASLLALLLMLAAGVAWLIWNGGE